MRKRYGLLAAAVAVASTACGGASGQHAEEGHEAAAQYAGPIASDDLARGESRYTAVCMACHASGPPLENIAWGPAAMRRQIREGNGGMPAIPAVRLSDNDMEAVLAHMTTIGAVVGDVGAEPMAGAHSGGEHGAEHGG